MLPMQLRLVGKVCPTLNVKQVEFCKRYSVPVMPGAFTPAQILTAWEAGADWVKVIPPLSVDQVI